MNKNLKRIASDISALAPKLGAGEEMNVRELEQLAGKVHTSLQTANGYLSRYLQNKNVAELTEAIIATKFTLNVLMKMQMASKGQKLDRGDVT